MHKHTKTKTVTRVELKKNESIKPNLNQLTPHPSLSQPHKHRHIFSHCI